MIVSPLPFGLHQLIVCFKWSLKLNFVVVNVCVEASSEENEFMC